VTVSVVALNARAVAAVHVEAKANPRRARILNWEVTKEGVDGKKYPAIRAREETSYTLRSAWISVSLVAEGS
jgi:hypothetical protein